MLLQGKSKVHLVVIGMFWIAMFPGLVPDASAASSPRMMVWSEQSGGPVLIDTGMVPGQMFSLVIRVEEVPVLAIYNFTLSFNSTILSVHSVSPDGNIFGCEMAGRCFLLAGNISPGSVNLAVFGLLGNVDSSGNLATINFEVQAYGGTRLRLRDTGLLAHDLSPVPHATKDGYFGNTFGTHFIPHDAIVIHSDSELTPENGVVAGSGTNEDPYVIEGWDIEGFNAPLIPVPIPNFPYVRASIFIANTTAHLIIRHVQVHEGGDPVIGIILWNVTHVTVESSRVWNANTGVNLIASRDSMVISNEFYNLIRGVVIWGGPNKAIKATGNIVWKNVVHDTDIGIHLLNATTNEVTNNTIFRAIRAAEVQWSSSWNIFAGNHIFDSLVGIAVFSQANDNLITTNKIEIIEGSPHPSFPPISGISIGTDSWRNVAEHNEIRGFARGIHLGGAFDSTISRNNVQASEVGILVRSGSAGNRITGNVIAAPVGIELCSRGHNVLAPPKNDLRSSDRKIERCPGRLRL